MEMFNHSPLIAVLADNNLAHSTYVGSERITAKYYFFRSQLLTKNYVLTGENLTKPHFLKELLEKTRVLNHSQKRYLKSGVELSHLTFASHLLRNIKVQKANNGTITARISVTALLVSLLATCQPSYAEVEKPPFGGNSDFVEQLNKISYLPSISEIFSLISNSDFVEELNKINQLSFFDSFNYVDAVAVNGNNVKQELRKLLNTVQYHHTLVDVFLCLSLASCLFTGELRLALALVRLWRGGSGNKPLGANTTCRLCLAVFEPPCRPNFLGLITQTSSPFEKV